MARFTRKRITKADAVRTLGKQYRSGNPHGGGWEIYDINGRPFAQSSDIDTISTIRFDLVPEKGVEFRTTNGQVIVDQPFWPKRFDYMIDLGDFLVNANGVFQHPLRGFHIQKLIEATRYPFYHQDRVIVIPIHFSDYTLTLNPRKPNAVVFVECWSHFDDYDTDCNSPSKAFKIPLTAGTLWCSQFEDRDAHIGKNFIILPFGYCYDAAMEERDSFTTEEWNQLCTRNAAEWTQIIQDFLDGKDDEDSSADKTNDKAASIVEESNPADNQAEDNIINLLFKQHQKKQHDIWHDQFLSERHINLCEKFEYVLKEREDKNGVQIWRVAQPGDHTSGDFNVNYFEEFVTVNGVQYRVANFIYCAEHYAAFLTLLKAADDKYQKLNVTINELSLKV